MGTTRAGAVRARRRRRAVAAAGTALALVTPLACGFSATPIGADVAGAVQPAEAAPAETLLTWLDGGATTASQQLVEGRIGLDRDRTAPVSRVRLLLDGARLVALPAACRPSTVTRLRSWFDDDELVCDLKGARDHLDVTVITVAADASAADAPRVTGRVVLSGGGERTTGLVTPREIEGGEPDLVPDLRLLSSPDFLNGDVGDLRQGPNSWTPARSENSTNPAYERALDTILDDWADLDPAGVLVAGDLVDGRWGYDDQDTGTFGPVDTPAQRKAAVRRAARTYYPQWQQRFDEHGLAVFPAIGDHEMGDNPWPQGKRDLAPTFKSEWSRAFTQTASGDPLYADHPDGPARLTAYAGRPTPDVQVVTLDLFDITPQRSRIGLDPQQRRWFAQVLRRADRDGVRWIVVQGHVPVVWPVPSRGSSDLHVPGGTRSKMWRLMKKYGVDLYLAGEVHDASTAVRDGIVQVAHGGIFQFGLTTALTMDFYGDGLYLTLRDYDVRTAEAADGSRLWETRRKGMPKRLSVQGGARVIGTASVRDGRLVGPSGVLRPID
ncbi:MAG: hypothetical protein CMH83_01420 [Nocardioides sp.]|nr:hypothetical protein [Nocardioides sp.]